MEDKKRRGMPVESLEPDFHADGEILRPPPSKPFLEFVKDYVREHHRECYSKQFTEYKLRAVILKRGDEFPFPSLPDEDLVRLAKGFVEQFWPIPRLWREGVVDETREHILVRDGGFEDGEPEAIEVALIGPDRDDPELGLIIEFLPMSEIDVETAEGQKRGLVRRIERIFQDHAVWSYALYHCRSGANMYNSTRFILLAGRESGGRGRLAKSGEWRR